MNDCHLSIRSVLLPIHPLDRWRGRIARPCGMLRSMTTLEDLEKAVAELSTGQLAQFRAWFDEFEAARFDERIEREAASGKLDRLAEQALADLRAGRARYT